MATPKFTPGPGGWTTYFDPELRLTMQVRFDVDPKTERLVPAEAHLVSAFDEEGRIASISEAARRIPWGRLEAMANAPDARGRILGRIKDTVKLHRLPEGSFGEPITTRRPRKLSVPKGRGKYPDDFYNDFAAAYTAVAVTGDSPAAVLSEQNNVPRTTIHRWAKEARRRGFLAPGQRGKIG